MTVSTAPSTHQSPRVTPKVWALVAERDRRCVAHVLDRFAGPCRDRGNNMIESRFYEARAREFTVEHVQPDYGRMGRRPAGILDNLVLLCWGHHLWSSWATANKELEREYLSRPRIVAFNLRYSGARPSVESPS